MAKAIALPVSGGASKQAPLAKHPLSIQRPLPIIGHRWEASGWWGMSLVILTEGALFAYLFFSYFYLASQATGAWPPHGPPKLVNASINTALLLSSSVAAWWAERGIIRGRRFQLTIGLIGALVLGVVFITIQAREWAAQPFTFSSDTYGSLYFLITGFHGAHVIVGLLVLATLAFWNAMGYFHRERHLAVSVGVVYWHFVDLIWLAVFSTLYLSPHLS